MARGEGRLIPLRTNERLRDDRLIISAVQIKLLSSCMVMGICDIRCYFLIMCLITISHKDVVYNLLR